MAYRKESDMYPAVCQWPAGFLQSRHRGAQIKVFDTSLKSLARLIREAGLFRNLPVEWQSWDIYVDVVGFATTQETTALALAECKNEPLTLSHLSQAIDYSRIALPRYSILFSPQGASDMLRSLLVTFDRTDVLQYRAQRGRLPHSVAVARRNEAGGGIEPSSTVAGSGSAWM